MVGENFEILSHKSHDANEQVFISYGPHSNRRLFLDYGFVLPDNPNDVVVVTKEETELDSSQCRLAASLIKVILSDYNLPVAQGKDWSSQLVTALMNEEVGILRKQLCMYQKHAHIQ
ncbi:hypothetical protein HPB47_001153 [Ixodes persulcatus]|uniref:Uncharacterized protein n=1 Tax=Ixodes persulcatus TaxID=34615 RepID=A0AC60PR27_IXOPE|nr:hypothetical protein HPB47_001153 [Ixodes persulcatus]